MEKRGPNEVVMDKIINFESDWGFKKVGGDTTRGIEIFFLPHPLFFCMPACIALRAWCVSLCVWFRGIFLPFPSLLSHSAVESHTRSFQPTNHKPKPLPSPSSLSLLSSPLVETTNSEPNRIIKLHSDAVSPEIHPNPQRDGVVKYYFLTICVITTATMIPMMMRRITRERSPGLVQ